MLYNVYIANKHINNINKKEREKMRIKGKYIYFLDG